MSFGTTVPHFVEGRQVTFDVKDSHFVKSRLIDGRQISFQTRRHRVESTSEGVGAVARHRQTLNDVFEGLVDDDRIALENKFLYFYKNSKQICFFSFQGDLPRVQGCLFLRTKRLLQRETRTPLQGMTRILKPWATQGSLYSLVFGSYPSINLDANFTPAALNLLAFTTKAKMKTKLGILRTP